MYRPERMRERRAGFNWMDERVRLIEFARLLRSLMGGHWGLATFVLLILLVASLAEGIGFSLVIPLVEVVSSSPGAR